MLIERDAPLQHLHALALRAAGGAGSCVVLEGGAGIGKTAVLTHLRREAEAVGLRSLSATGADLEREHGFGLARQLLEPVWRATDPSERDGLLDGAASLARPLLDGAGPGVETAAPSETQSVLYGAHWLLTSLAERTPLLITVDDAHWADEPSLDLLAYVARRVRDLPALIVIATRPTAPGFADLTGLMSTGESMGLEPLTTAGIDLVAESIVGAERHHALADACLAATGGNPLYVRALLAELQAAGAHDATAAAIAEIGPEPVARSVNRRLAELPAGAAAVTEAVAILGDDATLITVAELSGLEPRAAATIADALARAGIFHADGRLAFAHPVIRATVASGIGAHEESLRHAQAASHHLARGSDAEIVARHVLRAPAGLVEHAHTILQEAARAASRRGAPALAAKLLARARQEPSSPDAQLDTLVDLGTAQGRAVDPAAIETFAQAAAIATDPDRRAAITISRAMLLYRGGAGSAAVSELVRELESGQVSDVTATRVRAALLTLADLDRSLRPGLATRIDEIAFEFAGRSGKPAALALVHQAVEARLRYRDAAATGDLTERALRACFATLQESGGDDPDPVHEDVLSLMVLFLDAAERFDAVAELGNGLLAHASRTGNASAYAHVGVTYAWSCLRRGALEDTARILQAVRDQGSPKTVWMRAWISGLGQALAAEFEPGAALAAGAGPLEDLDVGPHEMPPAERALLTVLRGKLRLAAGSIEDGLADVLQGGSALGALGTTGANYHWQSDAGLALARLGRPTEGRGYAAAELSVNAQWGAPRAIGVSRRAVALLEPTDEERVAGLQAAVEVFESSEGRLELARTLVALGAALRRLNRRADARAPLRRAVELAEACGPGTRVAAQARVELAAAGGRAPKAIGGGVGALTASERRIVELAMEGLSNPEVAQTLYISRRTVESHLTSAYGKLGIASRRELGDVLAGSL